MQTLNNVHQQFADFFESDVLRPFAYLVSRKLSEGHICVHLDEPITESDTAGFFPPEEIVKSKSKLTKEPLVTLRPDEKQPFVLHNNNLYLQRYFNYETAILNRIKKFIEDERVNEKERFELIKKYKEIFHEHFPEDKQVTSDQGELSNWPLIAAISAVLNDFTIITGGPGTGKTTTVARILAILYSIDPELKVALAAPTGKAAVRMAESLKTSASLVSKKIKEKFETLAPGTIHRLLKFIPGSPYFRHDKENPLNYDIVIVDESSMIDAALFAKLLQAIGSGTKLIMLGDKDQLASIEAGSLFGDLCKTQTSFRVSRERAELIKEFLIKDRLLSDEIVTTSVHPLSGHIIELKRSHRFNSDKGIGKFSKAVISNNAEEIKEYFGKKSDSQISIDVTYDVKTFQSFIDGYKEFISEPDTRKAIHKLNKLRVLCAIRDGEQGLYKLNESIEAYLKKQGVIETKNEFYINRPVIVTKNYYSLGLFNGDVGIIRPDESGVIKAWFEDSTQELKSVLPGYIAEVETVYAMTIHKSQGSEYDQVMVVLPNSTNVPILTRELLYTAVTRAKFKVFIQGTEEVILQTAEGMVKRASGITERFAQ